MTITVVITTWQVPFDHTVQGVYQCKDSDEALACINQASKEWWDKHDGDRCLLEYPEDVMKNFEQLQKYEPITELWGSPMQYQLWGGETGFHAFIDQQSCTQLHEEYCKKEYDDQGKTRPGFLINAYVAEGPEGEHLAAAFVGSEAKYEEYVRQQAAAIAEIEAAYSKPKN